VSTHFPRWVANLAKTFACVSACLIGLAGLGLAHDADVARPGTGSPTLARVFAAWKARQERAKSIHFNWEYRLALSKGYRFPDAPVIGGLKASGVSIESDEVHHTLPSSECWVEGDDRFRDDFSVVLCRGPKQWTETERYSLTVKGAKHIRRKTPNGPGATPQVGTWAEPAPERTGDLQLDARPDDLAPLLLTFRPFHPVFGWNPKRCRLVNEDEVIGGIHCATIQMDEISKSERCWVDPNRDYVIVKWEKRPLRMPRISCTIDYENDKVDGWVPTRWKRQLPGPTPDSTGTAEAVVTRFAVNETLPVATFELASPANTPVTDLSAHSSTPRDQKPKKSKPRRNPVYDPFAEPVNDLKVALKAAKEQSKRVLIDFGANWCGDCHALAGIIHDNAEVSAALKTGFVLVLVDVEDPVGRELYHHCAPSRKTMAIPHLAVIDPNGEVLASQMSEFAVGNYDVAKLKAFVAKWSPSK
jgi:thiol-disulfide isomerase/thioredoxin